MESNQAEKLEKILWSFRADLFPDIQETMKAIESVFSFKAPSENECLNYILSENLLSHHSLSQISEIITLFLNYYGAVGWVVGKGKNKRDMVSWKKALNNWCIRDWNKSSKSKNQIEETIKAYMLLQNEL